MARSTDRLVPGNQRVQGAAEMAPPTDHAIDVEAAGIAIDNASAILDLLYAASQGVQLPHLARHTLENSLCTVQRELERAAAALFGGAES